MTSVVRADTDQLRAVARQMRATADQITSGTDGMRQSMDALDATWSGQAHDRGMARWGEITPKYPPAVERLVRFANELEALAQRLDDAAAVFGGGLGLGGILSHIDLNSGFSSKPWWPLPNVPPGFLLPGHLLPNWVTPLPDTHMPTEVPPRIYIANGINSTAPDGTPDESSIKLKNTLATARYDKDQIVALPAAYNTYVKGTDWQGTSLQGTDVKGTNMGGIASPLDWITGASAGVLNTFTGAGSGLINNVTGAGASTVNTITGAGADVYNTANDAGEVFNEYMQGEHGMYTEKMISNIQRDLEQHPLAPGQKVIVIGYSGGGALSTNATPILEEMSPVRRSDGSYESIDVEGTVTMGSPVANVDKASRYSKVLEIRDAGDPVGTPIIRSEESRLTIPSGAGLGNLIGHPFLGALGGLGTGEVLRDHNSNIVTEETHSGRWGMDAHLNTYQTSPEVIELLKKHYPSIAKEMNKK